MCVCVCGGIPDAHFVFYLPDAREARERASTVLNLLFIVAVKGKRAKRFQPVCAVRATAVLYFCSRRECAPFSHRRRQSNNVYY